MHSELEKLLKEKTSQYFDAVSNTENLDVSPHERSRYQGAFSMPSYDPILFSHNRGYYTVSFLFNVLSEMQHRVGDAASFKLYAIRYFYRRGF
jgi:hypothetical protein